MIFLLRRLFDIIRVGKPTTSIGPKLSIKKGLVPSKTFGPASCKKRLSVVKKIGNLPIIPFHKMTLRI